MNWTKNKHQRLVFSFLGIQINWRVELVRVHVGIQLIDAVHLDFNVRDLARRNIQEIAKNDTNDSLDNKWIKWRDFLFVSRTYSMSNDENRVPRTFNSDDDLIQSLNDILVGLSSNTYSHSEIKTRANTWITIQQFVFLSSLIFLRVFGLDLIVTTLHHTSASIDIRHIIKITASQFTQ